MLRWINDLVINSTFPTVRRALLLLGLLGFGFLSATPGLASSRLANAAESTDPVLLDEADSDPVPAREPLENEQDDELVEERVEDPEAAPDPAVPQSPVPLNSHTYPELFSIGFPEGWQVSTQEDAPQLTATGTDALDAAPTRTEVTWHDLPPGAIVPQALDEIQANGYTVARYDAITVDGTTALRIWLTDLPDEDLPQALVTYIGYASTTVAIVSHYAESTPETDNLINGIHQSFQRQPTAGN